MIHYALREHGDFVATGGRDWHEDRRRGLRAFYAMLRQENLVITYDPVQGWGHDERQPTDDNLIVRIENPSNEQRRIWRFLPEKLAP